MGKSSLCLDNGPVSKIPFIATHSLESKIKIELPLMLEACRILIYLLIFLGV